MTESEVRAVLEWGWTSYKKMPWARQDSRHLYTFNLRSDTATLGFQTCTIQFWAKRPILAIREIIASGRDPCSYHHEIVNCPTNLLPAGLTCGHFVLCLCRFTTQQRAATCPTY